MDKENKNELENELENQQKTQEEITKLEEEKTALSKDVSDYENQKDGLEKAVAAQKQKLYEINENIRKIKGEDASQFEKIREENISLAIKELSSEFPELENTEVREKVLALFPKFDTGRFNVSELKKDITMSIIASNPDLISGWQEEHRKQTEAKQKMQQKDIDGSNQQGGSRNDDVSLTEREQAIQKDFDVPTEVLVKMRTGKAGRTGFLTGTERKA